MITRVLATTALLAARVLAQDEQVFNIVIEQDNREIPGDSPIELCMASDEQLLDIESIVLDPNPPEPGVNLTISAKGTLNSPVVEGSYVDIVVNYGFIQLIRQRYDLCEVLGKAELECPLDKGYLELTREVAIPEAIPPGLYSVSAQAFTDEDELLTCLQGEVTFDM